MANPILTERLTEIKSIRDEALRNVATIVNDTNEKLVDENEWNDFLLEVANTMGVTVCDLLADVEDRNSYDTYLAEQAEIDYQMMMAAENTEYGYDIDEIP